MTQYSLSDTSWQHHQGKPSCNSAYFVDFFGTIESELPLILCYAQRVPNWNDIKLRRGAV
nr:MAG TPA: hypothetical protein [Bacteriophage sp.]